jgi:hypothetical protein
MSLYQALIDFRDNNNDAMWIRQEDDEDMLSVLTTNKRDRGKSWLQIRFYGMEDYLNLLTDDNGYDNNSTLISIALGKGYYSDYVFIDGYFEADSCWTEGGYVLSYFNDENLEIIRNILKIVAPQYYNFVVGGRDSEAVGRFFHENFEDEASEIGYEYAREYDATLIVGLREHIKKSFCDAFSDFKIIKKVCGREYLTTVSNLIKMWDESDASEDSKLTQMLKEFAEKKQLTIQEDLHEDYYNYFDDKNFDSDSFNRDANRVLDKLYDRLIEDNSPEEIKKNKIITDKIFSLQYEFGEWFKFPGRKTFGKNIDKKFKFLKVDQGQVLVELWNNNGKNFQSWLDYDQLMNFLYHPELFD